MRIHVPDEALGRDEAEKDEASVAESEGAPGDEAAPAPKKRTRRGSRGGKGRKRKPATAAGASNGGEPADETEVEPETEAAVEPEPEPEPVAENGDFEPDYVPMSEWIDDFERRGR